MGQTQTRDMAFNLEMMTFPVPTNVDMEFFEVGT